MEQKQYRAHRLSESHANTAIWFRMVVNSLRIGLGLRFSLSVSFNLGKYAERKLNVHFSIDHRTILRTN